MTRAAGKRPRRGSRSRRPRAVRTRRLERVDPRTDDLRSADPPYPDADPHRHSGAGRRLGRRRWSTRRRLRRAVAGPEMDRSQGGTYGWPVAARPRWRKLRAARLAPPERRTGIRLINRWPSTYRGWTACFLSSAIGLRLPRSGPAGYFTPRSLAHAGRTDKWPAGMPAGHFSRKIGGGGEELPLPSESRSTCASTGLFLDLNLAAADSRGRDAAAASLIVSPTPLRRRGGGQAHLVKRHPDSWA